MMTACVRSCAHSQMSPRARRFRGARSDRVTYLVSLMDAIGIAAFVEELDRMTKLYGQRFAPPQLLRDMAKNGETFYSRFDRSEKKAA